MLDPLGWLLLQALALAGVPVHLVLGGQDGNAPHEQ